MQKLSCLLLLAVTSLGDRPAAAQEAAVRLLSLAEHATHTLKIPGYADFLALEGNDAWVTNEGRVEKVGPQSARPLVSVKVEQPCGAMAVDFGALWVANCRSASLVRIDVGSPRVVATIPTGLADGTGELSVATGAGSVWLLTHASGILSRVSPETDSVIAQIAVRPQSFAATFGFGSVWVSNTGGERGTTRGSVQRIDPRSNVVTATIPVGPTPRFLAAGAGGVWILNQGDGSVSRIDPASNQVVATIPLEVPGPGGDIAVGAGQVWVRAGRTLLSVIDGATNRVVARYGPPSGSGAVRANEEVVWVTAHDSQTIWLLRP
jgi:virginiamycin B lyase